MDLASGPQAATPEAPPPAQRSSNKPEESTSVRQTRKKIRGSSATVQEIAPYTLHPTLWTLHPTPYTLHPTPYTLHPTPYTLHREPHTLHIVNLSATVQEIEVIAMRQPGADGGGSTDPAPQTSNTTSTSAPQVSLHPQAYCLYINTGNFYGFSRLIPYPRPR